MGAPTPPLIQEAFASAASGSYITNPIPLTTGTTGAASYSQGFPAATFQQPLSGGVPPFGQDMNGILFAITSHIVALQSGEPYTYNSTLESAISGYPIGTILGTADGTGLWIKTTTASPSNPDTGGAGWQSLAAVGIVNVTGLTNANVTLSAVQAAKPILAFSGTLTGNVQIIFPALAQEWTILNETTGAYTLTCKTASGSGVIIPQGGATQPSGIVGDGTNIYAAYGPISATPSNVGPVANTLALRDNTGRLYATYVNQSSNPAENPTIGSVAVQNSLSDGFFRFATLANFASQLFGGSFRIGTTGSLSPGSHAITFATPFPTACQIVLIQPTSTGSGAQAQSAVTATSASGFTIAAGATVSQSFSYLAIGN